MGGLLPIGPCTKPRVAVVLPASMDVVELILWSTTSHVNMCGLLSFLVHTVPCVLFAPLWPRESALLIRVVRTLSSFVIAFNAYSALRNNHFLYIDSVCFSSAFTELVLIACGVMQYLSDEVLNINI